MVIKEKLKKKNIRRCEYCLGKLSTIAHFNTYDELYLICEECGRGNVMGKSNSNIPTRSTTSDVCSIAYIESN